MPNPRYQTEFELLIMVLESGCNLYDLGCIWRELDGAVWMEGTTLAFKEGF